MMATYEAFTTQSGKPIYVCSGCLSKAYGTYKLDVMLTHLKKVHSDE